MNTAQTIVGFIGGFGGLGGLGALVGLVFQQRKVKADSADVLTRTALTLIEPLQRRVQEVDVEAANAREEVRTLRTELGDVVSELGNVLSILRRWKSAILDHSRSREELERMVLAEYPDKHQ